MPGAIDPPGDPFDERIDAQIDDLVDDLRRLTGHDFSQYARDSRRRRVQALLIGERLATIADLRRRLREEPACRVRALKVLTVPVTAMFRDPPVHRALRAQVVPLLATYPLVRVWLAGCATGEEAWSMAILLHEEGLAERARIYATDVNPVALDQARSGIFPLRAMRDYTLNYQRSGGRDFSRYYTAAYGYAKFDAALARNLVFAQHNLAVEPSFNEFHLILCRNVLIYFDQALQARVHRLLHDSLPHLGVLCLGARETLGAEARALGYTNLDATHRLYRKTDLGARAPRPPGR